jgi:hypothetical protein
MNITFGVFHLRVGVNARVIERALPDVAILAHARPGRARVVGGKRAAVFGFDLRIDAVRVDAGDDDADLAEYAFRHPRIARKLGPVIAAVGRLEESAAGAAARHHVRHAERFPQRRVHDLGIFRIEIQLDAARLVVAKQHLLPGLAAVFGSEDTAFGIRAGGMAERRDEDDVGVGGMDPDLRDHLRLDEPDVRPRLARVSRLVHAVALRDVAAQLALAHPDVDDVRVRWRDGDGADRGARELAVGDRGPGCAAVDRLPKSAAGRAEIIFVRARRAAGGRNRSAAPGGTDAAPVERAERLRRVVVFCLRRETDRLEGEPRDNQGGRDDVWKS